MVLTLRDVKREGWMKIDIVIPSHNRPTKLKKCLNSIMGNMVSKCTVYVYFSSKFDMQFTVMKYGTHPWLKYRLYEPEFHAAEFWNSHLKTCDADIFMYLTDDVQLHPGCLSTARTRYLLNFPNFDGVLGLNQANFPPNVKAAQGAFGMIGKNYFNQFPDNAVFCQDFYCMYVDSEMELLARKHNRFYFSQEAKLDHFHPAVNPSYMDETNKHIRRFQGKDDKVWKERRRRGLLWGNDFELIRDTL